MLTKRCPLCGEEYERRPTPARPWGTSYCPPCYRAINLRYVHRVRARYAARYAEASYERGEEPHWNHRTRARIEEP